MAREAVATRLVGCVGTVAALILFLDAATGTAKGAGNEHAAPPRAAAAAAAAAAVGPAATHAVQELEAQATLLEAGWVDADAPGERDAEGEGEAEAARPAARLAAAPPRVRHPMSILRRATAADVRLEPFPYLVVESALEEGLYAELVGAYPSHQSVVKLAKGPKKPVKQNSRVDIRGAMALEGPARSVLSQRWLDFIEFHSSPAFWHEVLDVFGDAIREAHPKLEGKRKLDELRTALRMSAAAKHADVTMDCQVGVNTPVQGKPSPVRGPHIDNAHEIYAGLLYMREPSDPATGGALEVYRCKTGPKCKAVPESKRRVRGYDVQFEPETMETVATVPYEANTLAMFINTPTSYHGVTPRSASPFARRLVNVIGETPYDKSN